MINFFSVNCLRRLYLGGMMWLSVLSLTAYAAVKKPTELKVPALSPSQTQWDMPKNLMDPSDHLTGIAPELMAQQQTWVLAVADGLTHKKAQAMVDSLIHKGYAAFKVKSYRVWSVYIGPAVNQSTIKDICGKLVQICDKHAVPISYGPMTMGDFNG